MLCELSAHALLPADHPLAEQGEVSLRQLCNYPLVLTNQAYSSQHFTELFHFHGLQPQRLSKAYSLELQRGLVANGFGVAVAYTRPFGDHSYDGQPLAIRPIAEPLPPQRIALAEPRASSDSPPVNALRERAMRWFGESAGSAGAFSEVGDVDGKWKEKGRITGPFSLRCGSGSQRQRFRFRVFRQPLSPAPAALRPATCPAWCGARWRRPALRPTLCRSGSAVRLHTDRGRNLRPDRRGRWHRRISSLWLP